MTEYILPTYQELNRALKHTTLKLNPSQVHGLMCGILSADTQYKPAWEKLVTGDKNKSKTHLLLDQLYQCSAKQLQDFQFELQLLLPPDKESLAIRAESLTFWAQGFLTGLKMMHIPIINREPSDMTEAIEDLIAIAKMNYENVVSNEENEVAYIELVEYIRMAVILIYQESHHHQNYQNLEDQMIH